MTSDELRNVTFNRAKQGYQADDVDDFLRQAARDFDDVVRERDLAVAEKEDALRKMVVLAEKVEEYRGEENTLKTALINAQRMGEMVVSEAKQKADQIIREATGKAELLRQQADQEIKTERYMLEKIKDEVSRFKTTVLSMYKQHIESFAALDAPVLRVEEFLQEYYPPAEQPPEPQPEPEAFIQEAPEEIELPQPEFAEGQPLQPVGDVFSEEYVEGYQQGAYVQPYEQGAVQPQYEDDDDDFAPQQYDDEQAPQQYGYEPASPNVFGGVTLEPEEL